MALFQSGVLTVWELDAGTAGFDGVAGAVGAAGVADVVAAFGDDDWVAGVVAGSTISVLLISLAIWTVVSATLCCMVWMRCPRAL